MLIAIDGACKRNGQETCSSTGVCWVQTEQGGMFFKAKFETMSTSQRGEINGLLSALRVACDTAALNEDIIIITDSEYLYNTIMKDWIHKWRDAGWVGGQGTTVKNADMWTEVCVLLDRLNTPGERVFMQWTKGHIMSYTPANVRNAMKADSEGIELYTRVRAVAERASNRDRIVKDFKRLRAEHERSNPPDEICLDWVIANTMADCLASYVEQTMDNLNY